LKDSCRNLRSIQLQRAGGKKPVRLFDWRSRKSSNPRFPRLEGIKPVRLLEESDKIFRDSRLPRDMGMDPDINV
jgi:hypothetical protein